MTTCAGCGKMMQNGDCHCLNDGSNRTWNDVIQQMRDIRESGGTWCIHCGKVSDTVIEGRKHDLAEHYDYVMAQCNGDKELLRKWANNELEEQK